MLYSLIKFKVMTDGSLVLIPWKQSLESLISELQALKEDRPDIGIQYIEPRELDVRILFYNSTYREIFIRTNVIKSTGLSALWLPDPDVIKAPNAIKPETDELKSALNSIYGVKSMKKLGDATSIHISTAGFDSTLSWAGVDYKPISSLYDAIHCNNEPFTFEFKEDKYMKYKAPILEFKSDVNALDRVIRHVQVNEKKKVVTIVWKDGEVTMAKCGPNDMWDPEKGVLVCVAKRFFNSNTQFSKWLKSVIPEPEEETKSLLDQIIDNMLSAYKPKHAKEDDDAEQ